MEKTQFVKDLREKDNVASVFLIKFSAVAMGKNGKPYMNLVLMDKTGEVEARLWDDVQVHMGQAVRDAFVRVEGRCQAYQGRRQVVISRMQVVREDEIKPDEFIPAGQVDVDEMYDRAVEFIESMQDPHFKALAQAVFCEDADIVDRVKRAPAAKALHHAYPGGLIEHVVAILEILDHLSRQYGKWVDRDLLLMGGFFHDIGKLWELNYERVVDYTTEGKLIGHLIMGVELIDRKIHELEKAGRWSEPFPLDKKLLLKHVILAHHGELEFGSPKRPKCLEALIVHMVDDLDSKVNSIRTFTEQDQTPGRWTALSRQYERFFYKPDWAMRKDG